MDAPFSSGNDVGQQLRKICLDGIARGQTRRAKKTAHKRFLKYLMLAVTLAGAATVATLFLYH